MHNHDYEHNHEYTGEYTDENMCEPFTTIVEWLAYYRQQAAAEAEAIAQAEAEMAEEAEAQLAEEEAAWTDAKLSEAYAILAAVELRQTEAERTAKRTRTIRRGTPEQRAEYEARRNREKRPSGKSDKAGRWYPSEEEYAPCCDKVRTPSRKWATSLYKHCLTLNHIMQRDAYHAAQAAEETR